MSSTLEFILFIKYKVCKFYTINLKLLADIFFTKPLSVMVFVYLLTGGLEIKDIFFNCI